MSYLTQNEIANNRAMLNRTAQAAASEGQTGDPDRWTYEHRRVWAAAPGWSEAWESARVTNPAEDYDPGTDESVITDAQILSQIQGMLTPPHPG